MYEIQSSSASTKPETATLQINCSLRERAGGNPKKIHTEKAISSNDVFWPSSMEVNWIVKASQCLGLTLQSTKLPPPTTLVLRLSKMDDLLGYIVAIQTIFRNTIN